MSFVSLFTPAFKLSSSSAPPLSASSQAIERKRKREVLETASKHQSTTTISSRSEVDDSSVSITSIPPLRPSGSTSTILKATEQHSVAGRVHGVLSRQKSQYDAQSASFEEDASESKTGSDDDDLSLMVGEDGTTSISQRRKSRPSRLNPFSVGFRRQHVDVLTAVLHRCLLEGDFQRAGRAWAMLLRADINGHPMDPRVSDRWGIGAEVLYQQGLNVLTDHGKERPDWILDENILHEAVSELSPSWDRTGFEAAHEYFERLILQHPYRKTSASAVGELHYYPAMFGLWLFSEQELFRSRLRSIRKIDGHSKEIKDAPRLVGTDDSSLNLQALMQQRLINTQLLFSRRAEEIASRLDKLMISPPHSDDARFWHLRGMVALWIADLNIISSPAEAHCSPDKLAIRAAGRSDSQDSLARHQTAMEKAKQAFANVVRLGGECNLASVHPRFPRPHSS